MNSIAKSLIDGSLLLKNHKISNTSSEARVLMCHTLGISQEQLLLNQHNILSDTDTSKFQSFLNRCIQGEPLAYITQIREFFGIEFFVNENVLIPRHDTEILVETVIKNHQNKQNNLQILELGVGSGCVLLSLLKNLPHATGVGVDLSAKALLVAQKNALRMNLHNRVKLIQSNWYENVESKFDIIVANPPYVDEHDKSTLSLNFEPEIALFAKQGGVANYACIAQGARHFLKNEGSCYVEIGIGASITVKNIFEQHCMQLKEIHKDLGQIERCMKFTFQSNDQINSCAKTLPKAEI